MNNVINMKIRRGASKGVSRNKREGVYNGFSRTRLKHMRTFGKSFLRPWPDLSVRREVQPSLREIRI